MPHLDRYYALRTRKKSDVVTWHNGDNKPKAYNSLRVSSKSTDYISEKMRFLASLEDVHGPLPAALLQSRAGLTQEWANNKKPLTVRDIRRTWELENSPELAPAMGHQEVCVRYLSLGENSLVPLSIYVGYPLTRRTVARFYSLCKVGEDPRLMSGIPDPTFTKATIKAKIIGTLRDLYLARFDSLKCALLEFLPAEVRRHIAMLMGSVSSDDWLSMQGDVGPAGIPKDSYGFKDRPYAILRDDADIQPYAYRQSEHLIPELVQTETVDRAAAHRLDLYLEEQRRAAQDGGHSVAASGKAATGAV